ncbi:MAG TPA: hypothetical protein PKN32_03225 [Bacteroidales bacterium]|nr:hypothetical protein [Bacteroidales bacterium]
MRIKNHNLISVVIITMIISSCKTYYIPMESFNEQFKDINSVELKTVYTKGPMGDIVTYKTYPIEYIKCVDKENNPIELKNSPSIEVRITGKNNKKVYFYFDQMFVQDSILKGDGSRFIYYPKQIPIKDIKLIEIQDGHKNFKYIDKKQ